MSSCRTLRILAVCIATALIFLMGVLFFLCYQGKISWFLEKRPKQPAFLMTPFSGTLTSVANLSTSPPIGVMIENEFLARPFQKGLSQASVVYEAPTEGRITRFLAIFPPDGTAEKVGPVRSARSYFVDWICEYGGVYVHVGGHKDALQRLRKEPGIFNADQFVFEPYFRRENLNKTSLEHTMFTTAEKLEKLIRDQKWVWEKPAHIQEQSALSLSADEDALRKPANKININFGHYTYTVDYEYDPARHMYKRFQAKHPHIDNGNGKQIEAAIVVVQRIKSWSNGDLAGSISMKTVGSGDATIFVDGKVIPAKWTKVSSAEPTRFFYSSDGWEPDMSEEFYLGTSPVWFEILPMDNEFTYE